MTKSVPDKDEFINGLWLLLDSGEVRGDLGSVPAGPL